MRHGSTGVFRKRYTLQRNILLQKLADPATHRMSTIVSSKARQAPCRDVVVVVPDNCSNSTKTLASDICHIFQRLGNVVVVKDLGTAVVEARHKSIISLLDYEAPLFEDGIWKHHSLSSASIPRPYYHPGQYAIQCYQ